MNEMVVSARIIIAIVCLELLTGRNSIIITSIAKGQKGHFLEGVTELSHAKYIHE